MSLEFPNGYLKYIQVFCYWIKVLSLQSLKFHKASGNFWPWVEVWIWESLSNMSSELQCTWGLVLLCSYTHLSPKCRTAGREVHPDHSMELSTLNEALLPKWCFEGKFGKLLKSSSGTLFHTSAVFLLLLLLFVGLRIRTVSQIFWGWLWLWGEKQERIPLSPLIPKTAVS